MNNYKFDIKHCEVCDKETTHETQHEDSLNRCLGCLLSKDQIKKAKEACGNFKSYKEDLYVSGDPDY